MDSTDETRQTQNNPHRRRASQSFAEMFIRRGSPEQQQQQQHSPPPLTIYPGSITSAAASASARQRRMSLSGGITTSGLLSTSPSSSSHMRRASIASSGLSSASSTSAVDESAIEEESGPTGQPIAGQQQQPASPFARRMSFGARALRDMSRPGAAQNEGFNWADNLRQRAERGGAAGGSLRSPRSSSMSQDTFSPVQSTPRAARPSAPAAVPDHFQERILKGDFYMD